MLDTIRDRWYSTQRFVRTMVVIAMQPVLGHRADFLPRFKDIAVEQLRAIGSVEAFEVSVMRRFT